MRAFALRFALAALSLGLEVHAYSEGEAISAVKNLFARQSPGAGEPSTPTSPFDTKSPTFPSACHTPCDIASNAGNTCKDVKCLCTADHAEALGKCVNCVIGSNVGASPVEASFVIAIFEEVCKGNGVTNLPTPTVSLPPNFTLPPGVSTGPNGQFSIGTTVTASISEMFGTPAGTTVVIPPPDHSSGTATVPPETVTTHVPPSASGSSHPTSTASHSNAAALSIPTALDFVPMAVVGAIMALA
ncbi:hypothetical protein ONZ45_g5006 [Pleurotus djamor]|nr:hypothetical protein ONZ45_g5006 [Pleurotus djamor]